MSINFFVILVLVVAVGAVLLSQRDSSSLSGDAVTIEQLRAAGSDLTKPHEIEFFMYFPSEASALSVAEKLNAQGFKAMVKPAVSGGMPWHILATRTMIPEVQELERVRGLLTPLCESEHGEYDGWGTPIVK